MGLVFWNLHKLTGEGNGTPLQYSCLENPKDRGAWWAAVLGVANSWTRLSDFTFTFYFHVLEKEMATHSSVLAWRIPGTGEPGRLPSMGSHRVGHYWSDLAVAASNNCKSLLNIREGTTHGHHHIVNIKIRLIIFFAAKDREEVLYSQQKQDKELTAA